MSHTLHESIRPIQRISPNIVKVRMTEGADLKRINKYIYIYIKERKEMHRQQCGAECGGQVDGQCRYTNVLLSGPFLNPPLAWISPG